jgi:hypothetical protein
MARYFASVATLQNFLPLHYGGIVRRPGFQHIAEYDTGGIRLIPFRYSSDTTFILAFGNQTLRFYSNGAEVLDEFDTTYEIPTPYSASELSALRWEQVKDEVFLVHPNYAPRRLFRIGDNNWTLGEWGITYQPFQDANTDTTLTVTASGLTGSVTLTANSARWNSNHVGSYWRIGHVRSTNAQAKVISSTGGTTGLLISGVYTIRTLGTWTATIQLEASRDNSTWEVLKSWTGADDLNIEHRGSIDEPLYIRANVSAYTSGTSARVIIEADQSLVWGVAKITAFGSSTSVTATVTETLQSTNATSYWAEGSWSADNGYPSQIVLHDGRMTLAATTQEPLTMWASVIDDYPNFRQVAGYPDYALQRTLYSATADQINWMTSRNGALIAGTAGDEWVIRNASDPDTAVAQRSSAYGSAAVGVVELNDSLLFVQRRGTKVRDYIGLDVNDDLARDPYSAAELTLVAEHVTRSGIVQLAVSQQPDSILWCVTEDGNLASLTYERNLEVMGWAVHTTDGTIESVATIPGDYGDEVWIAVLRDGTRRIERLHPTTPDEALEGDTDDCLYLDAGKLIDLGTPGTAVTGLDHLEGLEVAVLVDGGEHPNKTVASGAITLDRNGTKVAVGLPYTSLVETLPLVAATNAGSTRHQIGRAHRIIVDLYESFGLEYADATLSTLRWYPLQTRISGDTPNVPPPLDTMPVITTLAGKHDRQPRVKIKQEKPLPATILSLAVSFDLTQSD